MQQIKELNSRLQTYQEISKIVFGNISSERQLLSNLQSLKQGDHESEVPTMVGSSKDCRVSLERESLQLRKISSINTQCTESHKKDSNGQVTSEQFVLESNVIGGRCQVSSSL